MGAAEGQVNDTEPWGEHDHVDEPDEDETILIQVGM